MQPPLLEELDAEVGEVLGGVEVVGGVVDGVEVVGVVLGLELGDVDPEPGAVV